MQIMSKNVLSEAHVLEIAESVQYSGQLLYSTTITTLRDWKKIEPLTSSPLERLETCKNFCRQGIPTNVLLKPFFESITGAEIEEISDLLIKYGVDYCTIGVLYWDEAIYTKISSNSFMRQRACFDSSELNHLDCAGESQLNATRPEMLRTYIDYLRGKGIAAFLKSSCVSSNVLNALNKSNYYASGSHYCINCGNCNGKVAESFL